MPAAVARRGDATTETTQFISFQCNCIGPDQLDPKTCRTPMRFAVSSHLLLVSDDRKCLENILKA